MINMEPSNLSKLENGNQLPKKNITKITETLDIKICELFDFEHKKSSTTLKNEFQDIINNLTQKELEFTYKFLTNLKILK